MQEFFSSDNAGNRVPPDVCAADPVAASGQQLTNGSADTDTTVTVVAGGRYAVTSYKTGGFILGIADVETAANAIWVCPLYQTIVITVPVGITTLHYATNANDGIAYLRKLN